MRVCAITQGLFTSQSPDSNEIQDLMQPPYFLGISVLAYFLACSISLLSLPHILFFFFFFIFTSSSSFIVIQLYDTVIVNQLLSHYYEAIEPRRIIKSSRQLSSHRYQAIVPATRRYRSFSSVDDVRNKVMDFMLKRFSVFSSWGNCLVQPQFQNTLLNQNFVRYFLFVKPAGLKVPVPKSSSYNPY